MKLIKPFKKEIDKRLIGQLRFVEIESVSEPRTVKRYITNGKGSYEEFEKVTVIGTEYKRIRYPELVVSLIRKKYNQDEENAIIRKKIAGLNDDEFAEYNSYAENCKAQAREYIETLESKFDKQGKPIEHKVQEETTVSE